MRLRFLGKNSVPGDSPTLYATDRDTYVVQGWKVTDPEVLAKLDPPADETCVEVPAAIRRVRIISEPITDYIKWEHTNTVLNLEMGEDIRWLPRHRLPDEIVFPVDGNDWWLFDDRLVAVGHFRGDGSVRGHEIVTDPAVVADCARVRDQLWAIAIPHSEYEPV